MIYLSPYNSKWPIDFDHEKAALQKAIHIDGLEIEHIGSTAIPFIFAKPIIDIMIGVCKLSDVNDDIISIIEKNGYVYLKNYEVSMPYRRFFQKYNSDRIRTHHIHLVEINSHFWKRLILFRNYLCAHPMTQKDMKN